MWFKLKAKKRKCFKKEGAIGYVRGHVRVSKRRTGVGTGWGDLELVVNLGRGVRRAVRSEPDWSRLRTEGQGEEVGAVNTDFSVVKCGCEERGKEIALYLAKGGLSSRSLISFSWSQRACLSDEGIDPVGRNGVWRGNGCWGGGDQEQSPGVAREAWPRAQAVSEPP